MLHALTFVTSNPGKAKQLGRYLAFPVRHENIDLDEIQSLDPVEIIEYKTREAYRYMLSPVLVEDASLQFLASRTTSWLWSSLKAISRPDKSQNSLVQEQKKQTNIDVNDKVMLYFLNTPLTYLSRLARSENRLDLATYVYRFS
jgi:hypothetical protein